MLINIWRRLFKTNSYVVSKISFAQTATAIPFISELNEAEVGVPLGTLSVDVSNIRILNAGIPSSRVAIYTYAKIVARYVRFYL